MEYIKVVLAVLIFACLLLYAIGKKEREIDAVKMDDPKSEFMFWSFTPIGYGVLKLFPFLTKFDSNEARMMFRARLDYDEEVDAYCRCFLAHRLTILLTVPLIGMIIVLAANETGNADKISLVCAFASFATVGLFINTVSAMKKKESERIERIRADLPDMINRMVILLHGGLNMSKVFYSIGDMNDDSPLGSEIKKVIADIKNTSDVSYAMSRMQRRCPCYEVSRLSSIIGVAVEKGGGGVTDRLTELSLELWESKRNNVKKKSATLSQKLLLPTMLLFITVMALAAVPAFISMKQESTGFADNTSLSQDAGNTSVAQEAGNSRVEILRKGEK